MIWSKKYKSHSSGYEAPFWEEFVSFYIMDKFYKTAFLSDFSVSQYKPCCLHIW